jgi:hypothetical protein
MNKKFTPVDSAIIKEVLYNQEDSTLLIRFNKGPLWRYAGVTRTMYNEMMTEGVSVGKYFHAHIKSLPAEKITDLTETYRQAEETTKQMEE